MRFLADESCDFAVVRALRSEKFDVTAIAEISPAAKDADVLAIARTDQRILLTEDKDFGLLTYAGGHETAGVILIRFPAKANSNYRTPCLALLPKLESGSMELSWSWNLVELVSLDRPDDYSLDRMTSATEKGRFIAPTSFLSNLKF